MRGRLTQAHPRGWNSTGSSPHAWETLPYEVRQSLPTRFIPTCVGDSTHLKGIGCGCTVHPHLRGRLNQLVTLVARAKIRSPLTSALNMGNSF